MILVWVKWHLEFNIIMTCSYASIDTITLEYLGTYNMSMDI